ncbi:PHP domain-containing protein [Clostridium sp. YIM B02551]|uniref:PHP domain-containing protein n=1 Tax=Clostridium sp. YIM B02551 TaxID=2910679 RepID=UPI001EEAC99A|nr:PHP domain-containing protein [Clostridium sp. YIM B02551]
MKYADLHIHSTYSDGKLTPEEIVELAMRRKINYISITDHDTLESQYITENMYDNLSIIPGIELSTEFNDIEIHILGYFIDIKNSHLLGLMDDLKVSRSKRVEVILDKLNKIDIKIDFSDLNANKLCSLGRAHIASALVKKGYADTFKSAFVNYLIEGKPAYVKREKLPYKEILDIIEYSGGISVLAHPGEMNRPMELENTIKRLKCHGLKGIEVFHPSHNCEKINCIYNFASKYKLLVTGGSDCHTIVSKEESIIGEYGINECQLNKLLISKSKNGGTL